MAWGTLNTGSPIGTDLADITALTDRIDNLETGFTGSGLTAINIDGGYIDGTPIGNASPSLGAFTSFVASNLITGIGSFSGSVIVASHLTVVGSAIFNSTITSSGVITCASGLSTDGGATIKFDVVSGTWASAATGLLLLSIPHGQGTNIRGMSIPYTVASTGTITAIPYGLTSVSGIFSTNRTDFIAIDYKATIYYV